VPLAIHKCCIIRLIVYTQLGMVSLTAILSSLALFWAMKKLLSVPHFSQRPKKNNRSCIRGTIVYDEPDWSTLSLLEQLE
jgi:hypothetical protein